MPSALFFRCHCAKKISLNANNAQKPKMYDMHTSDLHTRSNFLHVCGVCSDRDVR